MATWLLVVTLNWGATIILGQFPSLQACVVVAEAADEALREDGDEEDWRVECCQAGSCILGPR